MTLQTNPAERREMVQAISERLGSPAVYLRTSTCAYRIGGLTVERDGSIISDDDALLEALRPMLIERGWLTDAEASVTKTEPTEQDSEITQMELSFPVEDWTVPQLKNFLHTLYSNQHILRRMMQSDALYIDRQMMERLDEAQTPADWKPGWPTVWRRACSRAVASRTAGSLSRRFRMTATRPAGRCTRHS